MTRLLALNYRTMGLSDLLDDLERAARIIHCRDHGETVTHAENARRNIREELQRRAAVANENVLKLEEREES